MIAELQVEEWRDIAGYEGMYQVSSLGSVRRLPGVLNNGRRWRGRVLKQMVDKHGYANVCLCKDNVKAKTRTGRLVAHHFIGPCPDGKELAHCDGVRLNNRVTNLQWKTHIDNEADKERHGTKPVGLRNGKHTMPEKRLCRTSHPMHKLTEDQVWDIRRLLAAGRSAYSLGPVFGVSKQAILLIKRGKNWATLT
jgi:hypothetical protein